MKTLEYIENYNAYQPYMLLNFNLSFEKDIAHDDICRTVIEVVEEVNIAKYVDFTNRNAHGYDGIMMFKLIMLAMADSGYVSTRKLSKLCKTDIRYMFIAQNQKPSHQAFQRFIHDDLTMPIEDIFYEINKYIESKISIIRMFCVLMVPNMKPTPIRTHSFGVQIQSGIELKDGKR